MKTLLLRAVIIVAGYLLSLNALFAQQKFPATVNVAIVPPYSVYLSDYISRSSNKLTATIIFNDFNEPSWEVYLKIKIESPNLKIITRPNFIPAKPLRVIPGIPYAITGDDLQQYFDFNNIEVSGMSKNELATNGKLLEGNYTFCFEAYDYRSGKVISIQSCAMANIRLNEPPRLIMPANETVIPINIPQNINFQWQLPDASITTIQYKVHIYELSDYKEDPNIAIANNHAVKIFESSLLANSNFLYDINSPLLQRGKKYVWRVQALQSSGRDEFKNNGFSKAGWFYDGYPENGNIGIVQPGNYYSFSLRDEKFFRWNAPDNLTKNQPYHYAFKIAQIQPNQTDTDAIIQNSPLHTEESAELTQTYGYDIVVNKRFESNTSYAWQVKAHTGEQTIASSPVYKFFGPPIIEAFYAGNHTVYVKKATGSLNDLSGEGETQISASGLTLKVYFNHIKIRKSGAIYVLSDGIVKGKYTYPPISLNPEYTPNGVANFVADSALLSSAGLTLKGMVTWSFPLPAITPNPAAITSKTGEINYDEYRLLGVVPLTDSLKYVLADPYGFSVEFIAGSDIVLRGTNNYYPRLSGFVTLPSKVKDVSTKRIKLPFTNAHKLDIITELNVKNAPSVDLLNNARLYLQPISYTFDFSETESPEKFQNDKEWKGVYWTKCAFILDKNLDKNNQLAFRNTVVKTIDASLQGTDTCWVTTTGLQFCSTKKNAIADSIGFNTFASLLTDYRINIQNSVLSSSYFKGNLKIPLISETREFPYTIPISERGFQFGYLDESLDGFKFTYNAEGGEQKLDFTINRAVFAAKERLDMNIDLSWPSLSIELKNLEGFKIWGNTNIGFLKPNGMISLANQANGTISTFPITVNIVGAGSNPGLYAFATTANVIMSDDVSGPEGPPVVNVYSIYHNKLLGEYSQFTEAITDNTANLSNTDLKNQDNELLGSMVGKETDLTKIAEQINQKLNFSHADIIDDAKKLLLAQNITAESQAATDSVINAAANNPQSKIYKLSAEQKAELHKKSLIAVNILISKYTGNLTKLTRGLCNKIDSITLTVNNAITDVVYTVVDSISSKIANKVNDDFIQQTLEEIASTTEEEISDQITTSISAFSENALKANLNPAKTLSLIITPIVEGVITEIVENGITNVSIDDLTSMAEQKLSGSLNQLGDIPRQIASKGTELLRGLDPQTIFDKLFNALKDKAIDKAKEYVQDKVAEAVSDAIGGAGGELAQYVASYPMNLNGIGKKFKGDLKRIVLDPVSVSLQTNILSLAGYIQFLPADPTYGDVWKGDITATVKVPVKFSFNIAYLVGKKDGLNYWFGQVRPSSAAGTDAIKDKKAYPLDQPAKIGPVEMVAASGRLYSHMNDNGTTIIPDASINYGAYLNVILFDSNNHGKTLYLNVATQFVVAANDDYVFDFFGKCMIRPTSPSEQGTDCDATAKGEVHFNYNSAKHHLVGSGSLVIKSPAVCAQGSIAVDIQPGKWYLAIGTRDNRIIFVPGCVGWSPTGWLILDQNTAELGLGLQYSINAKVGFDIGIVALAVRVDAGIAVGIMVKIQYSPNFLLMDAGIWADLWAKVVVDYKIDLFLASIKGSITLIDLYASANLTMHFNPPPKSLKGDIKGYLKLCGIVSCDFNATYEKEI